jgi:hypothetical protein
MWAAEIILAFAKVGRREFEIDNLLIIFTLQLSEPPTLPVVTRFLCAKTQLLQAK